MCGNFGGPNTQASKPVGCELNRLELTGATRTATPQSWFRPLSPRTRSSKAMPQKEQTPSGLRLRCACHEGSHFQSRRKREFHSGYSYVFPQGDPRRRNLRRARIKRQAPRNQPGTYAPALAPGHEAFVKISRSTPHSRRPQKAKKQRWTLAQTPHFTATVRTRFASQ